MRDMKISLLYTTARRQLIPEVTRRWHDSAGDWPNVEMLVVTDEPYEPAEPMPENVHRIVNTGRRDCVTGWNLAAARATGDIFVQVSDDLYPPRNWDVSIVGAMRQFTRTRPDVVLNLLDDRKLAAYALHPVLTRAAYEKLGYLYPPEFESMYCDNWFSAYHRKYSGFEISRDRFWSHLHHTTHQVAEDEVMRRHEAPERYARGRATLEKYLREHGL
jgi:hypothetical protein